MAARAGGAPCFDPFPGRGAVRFAKGADPSSGEPFARREAGQTGHHEPGGGAPSGPFFSQPLNRLEESAMLASRLWLAALGCGVFALTARAELREPWVATDRTVD